MAALGRRGGRQHDYTWPGYVDALSSLLMVVIFVLAVFVVAQFYLSEALTGRDQALDRLTRQLNELTSLLQLEQQSNAELRASVAALSLQLQQSVAERDRLTGVIGTLEAEKSLAAGERERLAAQIGQLQDEKNQAAAALTEEQRLSAEARAKVDALSRQIAALQQELARLNAALDASDAKAKEQQAQIVELSQRLNRALLSKVEELARYRSEFFGRLREVLGERKDIVISGDRFVFQSEVLFASGSADIGPSGIIQLASVADALIEISRKIPKDLDWILQVDGHTDSRPINTPQFKSNWELSSARAIAVVNFLASRGVPHEHLAARGFAEFQPIDTGRDESALARNRRIELKITTR